MLETEYNHFKLITDSLTGKRSTDEDTFSSIAVLAERLDRLRKTNALFNEVAFSEQVEDLALRGMISAIC
ncbi:MAG TPA: hypothetical protein HPP87_02260 [Planctomycetes bacterium]|nr:hypothetical protein [Planctomycetota bacterium]HIJ70171.1 hypothetical protein [Planctomycetota bacterium]